MELSTMFTIDSTGILCTEKVRFIFDEQNKITSKYGTGRYTEVIGFKTKLHYLGYTNIVNLRNKKNKITEK